MSQTWSVKTLAGPEECTTCADDSYGFKLKSVVVTRWFKDDCEEQSQGFNGRDERRQDMIELSKRQRQS